MQVKSSELRPGGILITKHRWSACHGTDLDHRLQRLGVTGIVLAGIASSIGVESTARDAHQRRCNLTASTTP
ncbi:nicotinamidase-related amidase [Actinomadura rupiterrae]|nr:nicotinamidase-related amidase [Actinomadura rupiterrae]